MNTLLADPPPASGPGEPPLDGPPQGIPGIEAPEAPKPGRSCSNCGTPMDPAQSWCLQCGAGAPGSLGGTPGWRSATAVLGALAVLVVGAGVAAYAALNKNSHKAPVKVLAAAPASTPATAPAKTPGATSTTAPGTTPTTPAGSSTTHQASKSVLPTSTAKPPKLPAVASTPESSGSTEGEPSSSASKSPGSEGKSESEGKTGTESKTATEGEGNSSTGAGGKGEQPSPIVLNTNAASTYNPYDYPATWFGDPRLAIDDDATTAWTAQINPAVAPKMAEGLLVNLKESKSVSKLSLLTATPGMTVQIYAAKGKTVPTTIANHAWVKLSNSVLVKNRKATIKLHHATESFSYLLLWIPKAPAGLVGTPAAPAFAEVNELVLFAPTTPTTPTTTPAK